MQSKEWRFFLKSRVSEIRVKRIRVNQGLGVEQNKNKILERLEYCYAAVAEF